MFSVWKGLFPLPVQGRERHTSHKLHNYRDFTTTKVQPVPERCLVCVGKERGVKIHHPLKKYKYWPLVQFKISLLEKPCPFPPLLRVPLMRQWQHIQARSRGWILRRVPPFVGLRTWQWGRFPHQQITAEVWQIFHVWWWQSWKSIGDQSLGETVVESSSIRGDYVLVPLSSCWKLGILRDTFTFSSFHLSVSDTTTGWLLQHNLLKQVLDWHSHWK